MQHREAQSRDENDMPRFKIQLQFKLKSSEERRINSAFSTYFRLMIMSFQFIDLYYLTISSLESYFIAKEISVAGNLWSDERASGNEIEWQTDKNCQGDEHPSSTQNRDLATIDEFLKKVICNMPCSGRVQRWGRTDMTKFGLGLVDLPISTMSLLVRGESILDMVICEPAVQSEDWCADPHICEMSRVQ
jgi:hypothetical protein